MKEDFRQSLKQSSKQNKILFFICMFSIILETIAKQFQINKVRPSLLIKNFAIVSKSFFNNVGYYLAYFSNILNIFKTVFKSLWNFIQPIFESMFLAIKDIFNSLDFCISIFFREFTSGYFNGMENTYFKLLNYSISFVILFVLLWIFETLGTYVKINKIKPSYHISFFAKNIYYLTMLIVYMFATMVKIFTEFNEYIVMVTKMIFPDLVPFILQMNESKTQLINSIYEFFLSPIFGITDGFQHVSIDFFKKHSLIIVCILSLIIGFNINLNNTVLNTICFCCALIGTIKTIKFVLS